MRFLFVVLVILFHFSGYTQTVGDSTQMADTTQKHPFKKAMMYSAIVPGGGQIFNARHADYGFKKAAWKVPMIYLALGAAGYFLYDNQKTQLSLKTEYTNRLNTGNPVDPKWSQYDDQGVLYLYRQYLDRRDLSILGVAAVYLFQIVDAGVEFHFLHFDVSQNLSLQIEPVLMNNKTPGLGLKMNMR